MNKKVSIIIPVYNTENYLRQTLDSVINQTYSDWECILVDDGSKDRSGLICDEYAGKDNRFIVIHQTNKGASDARNAGIEASKGEWTCFVDSDDTLTPDALSVMFQKAEEYNSDVCICKLTSSVPDTDEVSILSSTEREKLIWACLAFRTNEFCNQGYIVDGPVAKLFRSSIILDNKLRFVVGLSRSEDAIFDASFYHLANKIILFAHSVYYYRMNLDSVCHRFNPHLPDTLSRVLLEEECFLNNHCIRVYLDAVYVRAFVGMYQIILEYGNKNLSIWEHSKLLRQYLSEH